MKDYRLNSMESNCTMKSWVCFIWRLVKIN